MTENAIPASSPPISASAIPATEISLLGPVVKWNHIAYVPWGNVSHAPGVGTGNLAYVPDYLLSAPEYFAGNATKRHDNFPVITHHAPIVIGTPTTLEGIGGLTAGQAVTSPLLSVESVNEMGLGFYLNG